MLALVDTAEPSRPRRRALVGPLLALAGALALYAALWVIPWRLHPSTGQGALGVYRVAQDGNLSPMREGEPLPAGSKVAFAVSSEREASVVVLELYPRHVALASPSTAATGAVARVRPGGPTVLPDRPILEAPPGLVRFVALFCKAALPPETVLKAGQRALATGQGDPDAVHTLDLGCAEAFSSLEVVPAPRP